MLRFCKLLNLNSLKPLGLNQHSLSMLNKGFFFPHRGLLHHKKIKLINTILTYLFEAAVQNCDQHLMTLL